jgi:hypothetical protein
VINLFLLEDSMDRNESKNSNLPRAPEPAVDVYLLVKCIAGGLCHELDFTQSRALGVANIIAQQYMDLHATPPQPAPTDAVIRAEKIKVIKDRMISEAFYLAQPNNGDAFGWLDDNAQMIAEGINAALEARSKQGGK